MGTIAPIWVGVSSLVIADEYQGREKLSKQTVDEYAELIESTKNPWPFSSPCTAYRVKGQQILVDGFHRVSAVKKCGEDMVQCVIIDGTRTDALKAVAAANQTHGLRRSNNDKRRLVRLMLEDSVLAKWSDHKLAELCGVSHPFVGQIRGELETVTSSPPSEPQKNTSSDGATRPATKADAEMQRQKIVAAVIAEPEASDRKIGELVGCDHKTVGKVRKELSVENEPDELEPQDEPELEIDSPEPDEPDEPPDVLELFAAIVEEVKLLFTQIPSRDRRSVMRQAFEQLNEEDVESWC